MTKAASRDKVIYKQNTQEQVQRTETERGETVIDRHGVAKGREVSRKATRKDSHVAPLLRGSPNCCLRRLQHSTLCDDDRTPTACNRSPCSAHACGAPQNLIRQGGGFR